MFAASAIDTSYFSFSSRGNGCFEEVQIFPERVQSPAHGLTEQRPSSPRCTFGLTPSAVRCGRVQFSSPFSNPNHPSERDIQQPKQPRESVWSSHVGVFESQALKADIRHETELSASDSVSHTKSLAKLASDMNKSDGLTVLRGVGDSAAHPATAYRACAGRPGRADAGPERNR